MPRSTERPTSASLAPARRQPASTCSARVASSSSCAMLSSASFFSSAFKRASSDGTLRVPGVCMDNPTAQLRNGVRGTTMQDDEDTREPEEPSRSELRRQALDVLVLAKALVELSDSELERVPLSDDLRELVVESRRITANIARKRQMQFLAKHLRREEGELPAIRAALEQDRDERRRGAAELHRVEAW